MPRNGKGGSKLSRYLIEKSRRIPVYGNFDVVVAGGGVAGAAAAVSAAREGASVCLLEKDNAPGGLATLGLISTYLPLCDGRGNKVVSGLGEEMFKASLKYGPGEIPEFWRRRASREKRRKQRYMADFNPASFIISLEEMISKSGVKILYDSRVCGCISRKRSIKALIIENKEGRSAVAAGSFVDATGDADLCSASGERTVVLDTNKKTGWYLLFDKGEMISRRLGFPRWETLKNERTFSGINADDVADLSIESRNIALEDLKSRGGDYSETYPVFLPVQPQFRMTRRLSGKYELDEKEEGAYFQDAICMTGDWRRPGPVFFIPYRCLIGKTENLFVAGRCISVTESMWDITRAIPACVATGEAAGTAAALCAEGKFSAFELDTDMLRKKLLEKGVIINKKLAKGNLN